jgi:two-component system chemotaxis sensor kinase CheA
MSTASLPADDGFLRPEELAEIRRTFFDQGRDALEALARDILALEGMVPSRKTLEPLRRAAHTLKGDCASVGFGALSALSHAMEDAFVGLEAGARPLSAEDADVLLAAVDALKGGLEAGVKGRPEPSVEAMARRLRALGGDGAASSWMAVLPVESQARAASALAAGGRVVRLHVAFGRASRRHAPIVRRVLAQLADDVLAVVPAVAELERVAECDVFAMSRVAAADLLTLLPPPRGARLSAFDCDAAVLEPAHSAAEGAAHDGETVRIESARIDEMLTLVGELVTVRSTLAGVGTDVEPHLPDDLARRLADAQSLLARVLQDLQRSTMRMRMVPAAKVFRRFARVVRDLGRQTGKRIALRIEGENTELDRGILDALEEPLLHLVRNAVTHGIEEAPERAAKGKPEEARLTIRAGREGNQILIEVVDDGRGIDPVLVRRQAVEKGFLRPEEADGLPDAEALQLVFRSGLSTASAITEHAGRGVGLDVVRTTVESLRGSVTAGNIPGAGAAFLIRVPLTIAIIQALLFRAGGRQLAVPLSAVVEIAQLSEVELQAIGTGEIVRLREQVLGLVRLNRLLGLPEAPAGGYVMVLQCGAGRFGLLADEMCGQQELVIKRVHDRWIRTPLVAGASIVGGGVPTLILDVLSVYRAASSQGAVGHE